MFVSVIIPTYNRSQLLGRAINSVLGQTYGDLEVIVIDDGSDDDTSDIVSAYRDRRVTYIKHETNMGGSAARNTGIKHARGKIIAFLDDDDEWLPEKLACQIARFEMPGSSHIIYTGFLYIDTSSGRMTRSQIPHKRGFILKDLLKGNVVGTASAVAVRRECFAKAGLFDEGLARLQDLDMWIRLSMFFDFDYVSIPLALYHVHAGNRISGDNLHASLKAIDRLAAKYRAEINDNRDIQSTYAFRRGRYFLLDYELVKARREFEGAIRLYPYSPRYHAYFLLTLLGNRSYRALESSARSARRICRRKEYDCIDV